jgi:hypothetical protein
VTVSGHDQPDVSVLGGKDRQGSGP